MEFDIHSMLFLVIWTKLDFDSFIIYNVNNDFVFNSCCWDVIGISTSKTRRKRWPPPGFQWYRDQHQTDYGARKGVKDWFVEFHFLHIRYILYAMTLMLTFSVCLFSLQEQVAPSFLWPQTSFVLCPALSGFCISTTWTINHQLIPGPCDQRCSFSMKYLV